MYCFKKIMWLSLFITIFSAVLTSQTSSSPNKKELFPNLKRSKRQQCSEMTSEELKARLKKLNNGEFFAPKLFSLAMGKKFPRSSWGNKVLRNKAIDLRCSVLYYAKSRKMLQTCKRNLKKCKRKKGSSKTKVRPAHKGRKLKMQLNPTCYKKGTVDNQGLIRLCTECFETRTLGASRYPRQLMEISCSSTDPDCLTFEGTCTQQYAGAVVLRKTGRCIVCNGINQDEWEPEAITLKVGCSCRLRRNSAFIALL